MLKNFLYLFSAISAGFLIYACCVIFPARSSTQERVSAARGRIQEQIFPRDLGEKRMNWLLQVQDPNFYEHYGTDFLSGRITTITQSLVKFLYFEDFKPGFAKIKQSLIARYALDPLISKEEQLYLFLNLSYFGSHDKQEIRGFSAASRHYFEKNLPALTDEEYLQLLAMLFGPNELNPASNPEKNQMEVARIKTLIHP